jgi:3-hydroxyacyl-CoA dehydrogenase/enoyl-CoA hydratase/3-hydroxybutyryl-CoA epimerase
MDTLSLTVGGDGIALVTINVPDRPMNVLTPVLCAELEEVIAQVTTAPEIRGAILTSGKANGFVVGADLKELAGAFEHGITPGAAREGSRRFQVVLRRLETSGKPWAAAINGMALGGGLELALACHHRVLAHDAKAIVGLPEVSVGLLPGWGGTQRLPRLIGIPAALSLMLKGNSVKPAEALALGIVHALAASAELVDRARAWIAAAPDVVQPWDRKGFALPGGSGPLAPHAAESFMAGTARAAAQTQRNDPAPLSILSAVYEGTAVGIDTGLRIESNYFGRLLSGPVARNMMRTLFVNKGRADKLGRRPAGVPPTTVKRLGVIGAGMMGAGIAYVAARAGIEIVLLDATAEAAQAGKAQVARLVGKDRERGSLTEAKADALLARIDAGVDYRRLEGCDIVLEAVFEDRKVKEQVIGNVEAVLGEGSVVASNTSTLSISSFAAASSRPNRFIGLHFFSPVDRMPLLEIILGERTDEETLARALDFALMLRKTPVVVNDGPGFYTTRVFSAFIDEGMCMLKEGVEPARIENASKAAGMPVGALAQVDEVSLALSWRIIRQSRADGLPDRYCRSDAAPVVEAMVDELKRTGRHGGGFYDYPKDKVKSLWPGLRERFPPAAEQPDAESLKTRLLYIQALEAARCVEDGVITDPADADIGAILGTGFPQWTGGPLSLIDTVGLSAFVEQCERFAERHGERFRPSPWLKAKAVCGERFYPSGS